MHIGLFFCYTCHYLKYKLGSLISTASSTTMCVQAPIIFLPLHWLISKRKFIQSQKAYTSNFNSPVSGRSPPFPESSIETPPPWPHYALGAGDRTQVILCVSPIKLYRSVPTHPHYSVFFPIFDFKIFKFKNSHPLHSLHRSTKMANTTWTSPNDWRTIHQINSILLASPSPVCSNSCNIAYCITPITWANDRLSFVIPRLVRHVINRASMLHRLPSYSISTF